MKKIPEILFAAFFLFFAAQSIYAQDSYLHCGSTEAQNKIFAENPKLKQQFLEREAQAVLLDRQAFANGYKENNEKASLPIYIIPLVFHIIEQGGAENISDAQIMDEVRILNLDYRMLNADTSNVVASFQSIRADCGIQFKLAQKDPNGNCTNGIDRINSALTNTGSDGAKLNVWDVTKYLNVWVVKTITNPAGAAGYAYLPSNFNGNNDGVLILSQYIGSIGTGTPTTSRALTHEIGHYLNLQHTWGGTNNPNVSCGDDGVSDTPFTKGHSPGNCLLTDAFCTSGIIENVQNYMEYAYCSNMYTAGQKTRMRNALTSSIGQRNNLWSTTNLATTGVSLPDVLCHADLQSNNLENTTCQGGSLTFTDLSWNGTPTSWSWTFQGGTPATSTDSAPVIHYNTPGIYNVGLTVTNSSGSATATKTGFVTVNPSAAMYNNTMYSESFEGSAIPNNNWQIHNLSPGGNTWVQTTTAAATGSKSVMINNLTTSDSYVDELIGPSIDMTAITGNISLSFKVAYAQRTSTSQDKLQLYVSSNCGQTWSVRKSLSGIALATTGVQSTPFTPTASQWVQQTVSLTGYSTQTDLFFMFRFTSNGGNNIYLDDINIGGATGIENNLASTTNFNVYPNPAEENTTIYFNLLEKQKVELKIYDIVGSAISSIFNGDLNAGEHQYSVAENANLSSGIYFVTLSVGGQRFTKKLVVK